MTRPVNPGAVAALLLCLGAPAGALTLAFPGPAQETGSLTEPLSSYRLPTAGWDGTAVPARVVEGAVERRSWRIDTPGATTLELLAPLRAQLTGDGFETVFECETADCGGFDFRFAIEVLPEPEMHVDLGDYRFLSAVKGDEAVGLLVSRSAAAGFVQLTKVSASTAPDVPLQAAGSQDDAQVAGPSTAGSLSSEAGDVSLSAANAPEDQAARLDREGWLLLDDLQFDSGSATLAKGKYPSLLALSAWLAEDPARRIALVGHTDTSGGIEANIAISRQRAGAVRDALVADYGVGADRLTADGVGYLSPVASNATEEGRTRNRRVEAVVTAE